jgi:hypothetical protein
MTRNREDVDVGVFKIFPIYIGTLRKPNEVLHHDGYCFTNTTLSIQYFPSFEKMTSVSISVSVHEAKTWTCLDVFLIAT